METASRFDRICFAFASFVARRGPKPIRADYVEICRGMIEDELNRQRWLAVRERAVNNILSRSEHTLREG